MNVCLDLSLHHYSGAEHAAEEGDGQGAQGAAEPGHVRHQQGRRGGGAHRTGETSVHTTEWRKDPEVESS